jgi:hypothetical protein
MRRSVKNLKRGDYVQEEIVVYESGSLAEAGSVEAWKDLNVMLQACLDSGLLRSKTDAPDRIVITHHEGIGWRIEVSTVTTSSPI